MSRFLGTLIFLHLSFLLTLNISLPLSMIKDIGISCLLGYILDLSDKTLFQLLIQYLISSCKSNDVISFISKKTNGELPIIGVGGILTPEQAINKIKAGAHLIQLYTGIIYEGPGIVKKINKKLLNQEF